MYNVPYGMAYICTWQPAESYARVGINNSNKAFKFESIGKPEGAMPIRRPFQLGKQIESLDLENSLTVDYGRFGNFNNSGHGFWKILDDFISYLSLLFVYESAGFHRFPSPSNMTKTGAVVIR